MQAPASTPPFAPPSPSISAPSSAPTQPPTPPPDTDTNPASSSASPSTRTITTLTASFTCDLCRSLLTSPVLLNCEHIFCSACLRTHLTSHSACPSPSCRHTRVTVTAASLTPLRALDRALNALRNPPIPAPPAPLPPTERRPLIFLSRKDPAARSRLTAALAQLSLPTTGTLPELAHRHKSFVIAWNANLDGAFALPKSHIAARVADAEKLLRLEERKRNASNRAPFFTPRRPPAASASTPDARCEPNTFVPEEGDDHDTLIWKTRRRDDAARRQRGLPVRPWKRRRSQSPEAYVRDANTADRTAQPAIGAASLAPVNAATSPRTATPAYENVVEVIDIDAEDELAPRNEAYIPSRGSQVGASHMHTAQMSATQLPSSSAAIIPPLLRPTNSQNVNQSSPHGLARPNDARKAFRSSDRDAPPMHPGRSNAAQLQSPSAGIYSQSMQPTSSANAHQPMPRRAGHVHSSQAPAPPMEFVINSAPGLQNSGMHANQTPVAPSLPTPHPAPRASQEGAHVLPHSTGDSGMHAHHALPTATLSAPYSTPSASQDSSQCVPPHSESYVHLGQPTGSPNASAGHAVESVTDPSPQRRAHPRASQFYSAHVAAQAASANADTDRGVAQQVSRQTFGVNGSQARLRETPVFSAEPIPPSVSSTVPPNGFQLSSQALNEQWKGGTAGTVAHQPQGLTRDPTVNEAEGVPGSSSQQSNESEIIHHLSLPNPPPIHPTPTDTAHGAAERNLNMAQSTHIPTPYHINSGNRVVAPMPGQAMQGSPNAAPSPSQNSLQRSSGSTPGRVPAVNTSAGMQNFASQGPTSTANTTPRGQSSVLSPEQMQRIERNKRVAIERKRLFQQRRRLGLAFRQPDL